MCKIYKPFNSVKEFNEYLDNGQTQRVYKGKECSLSLKDSKWYGTRSFEEANKLMLYGDKALLKRIEEAGVYTTRTEIRKYTEHKKIVSAVVGASPNVPAYLASAPNAMMRYEMTKKPKRVVSVGYNTAVFGGTRPDDIIAAGARLVSALMILEAKGIKANVYCLNLDKEKGGQFVSYSIKIKSSGQKFDLLRMAYFLAHPSMNRRHKFRFQEVTPGVTSAFVWGYGCPETNDNIIKEHFKKYNLNLDAAFNNESLESMSVEEVIERIISNK